MSTAAKTKSRDNKKVVNDSQKTPTKASGSIGGAYNPLLGTFQTVESNGSSSLHSNGRFKNIDESDSNCDSASNNGSWSGDSEDHKEKPAPTTAATTTTAKQETIPGADNDKREKMRLKNERKHQRQKEKRAQELHERCCQFLMSRKLEVLAQKIIAMGIAHEDATYALMLNEGKIEESINWLFDNDKANLADKKQVSTSGNLKLDISQELSRILELETKYKCSKQDVEKSVVTAEGDIEKAEESLRRQKQEQSTASVKVEDVSNSGSASKVPSLHTTSQNSVAQLQSNSGMYHTVGEVERKNLGYPRGSSYISGESGNQSVNPMNQINMTMELMKMQQNAAMEEKKRMSYQQTPLPRPAEEAHYVASLGDQFNRVHQQEMREPVMLMHPHQQQRSQSAKTNVLPVSTMNPSFTVAATAAAAGGGSGWYPANRSEVAQSNGYLPTRTLPPTDLNPNLMYQQQLQYQQYQGQVNNGHRMVGASAPHAVAPAASLGLFSGYGSTTHSSGVEWSTDGSVEKMDYNTIDWSLDRSQACPRPNQQQYVEASPYETNMNGRTRMMGNGNGMSMAMGAQEAALVGNGREWTSPFEGKDLFSLSRQYVPPSL